MNRVLDAAQLIPSITLSVPSFWPWFLIRPRCRILSVLSQYVFSAAFQIWQMVGRVARGSGGALTVHCYFFTKLSLLLIMHDLWSCLLPFAALAFRKQHKRETGVGRKLSAPSLYPHLFLIICEDIFIFFLFKMRSISIGHPLPHSLTHLLAH